MRSPGLITIIIVFLLASLASSSVTAAAQDDITVEVSLDRDTIGLDEQATLQIVVSGAVQNLPEPQLPTLAKFEIYSQGRSSNISIVNGQVSSSVTYRFLLLPQEAGTYPIDQIAVVMNNRRYVGNAVEITIANKGTTANNRLSTQAQDDAGGNRDYFLEAAVDKNSPYVNEQATLTLKFYVAVQYYGSPELTEPTTTGFWTEVLGNKAPYFQKINNRNYKVIERKYALFPTQTGELEIGRSIIRATVASRGRNRDPFDVFGGFFGRGEEITVRSNLIKLDVKPLPTAGKPEDFSGTIGEFQIAASANKRETEVNQPITVTLTISGTGNIKSVAEPNIEVDENQFRVYKASSNENFSKANDKVGGSKVFEEVFIPRRPGDMEIPAISLNYFDPKTSRYRTISTKPITVKVIKPEGYAASPDVPFSGPDLSISSQARDIRYIKTNLGPVRPMGRLILFTPVYLLANGVPVLLLAGLIAVRLRRQRLAGDVGYARSRAASREARKRLSKARKLAKVDSVVPFYTEVYTALTAFIADKLNISPHGLTAERIRELLTGQGAAEEMVTRLMQLMQKADFARYAPSSIQQTDIDAALKDAEDVMVRMEGIRFE